MCLKEIREKINQFKNKHPRIFNTLIFSIFFCIIILSALILECVLLTNLHEIAHVTAAHKYNITLNFNPLENILPCFVKSLTGKAGEASFTNKIDKEILLSNTTIAADVASAGIIRDLISGLSITFALFLGQIFILITILSRNYNLSFEKNKALFCIVFVISILSLIVLFIFWATINNMTYSYSDFAWILASCK